MTEARTYTCSICGDTSGEICVYCTKDACQNHICRKCLRCSDCCECEVPLDSTEVQAPAEPVPEPSSGS